MRAAVRDAKYLSMDTGPETVEAAPDFRDYINNMYDHAWTMSRRHAVVGPIDYVSPVNMRRIAQAIGKTFDINHVYDPIQVVYAGTSEGLTDELVGSHVEKVDQLSTQLKKRFRNVKTGGIINEHGVNLPMDDENHVMTIGAHREVMRDLCSDTDKTWVEKRGGRVEQLGTVALLDEASMEQLDCHGRGVHLFERVERENPVFRRILRPTLI